MSMSGAIEPQDELQDLSPEDARELHAFLEKRRWFEGTLKVLEALPPIYPFLHPILDPAGSDGFRGRASKPSQWELPSHRELLEWQKERDGIEEDVLAFDGGDLGRMKQKTRAVTLVPLTPPSTHLVEITLALIVLIDRLLTLLRHRSELLELTNLRLQWDELRWLIMLDLQPLSDDVDTFVRGKGRWAPHSERYGFLPSPEKEPKARFDGGNEDGRSKSAMHDSPKSSMKTSTASDFASDQAPSTPRSSSLPKLSTPITTSLPPTRSIPRGTPRRSLQLPLIRSTIVNLEIRHKTLASSLVKRSGAVLDRIIDQAGSLKGLGGVEGPGQRDEEKAGAVPDELLDLQDQLEAKVGDVGDRVEWCKQLERQYEQASRHHDTSCKAHATAMDVLDRLKAALREPATSERHEELEALLAAAVASLPLPINHTFPRPLHDAYPDQEIHNCGVIETLQSAQRNAFDALERYQAGIDWYGRLAVERHKALSSRLSLSSLQEDMRSALARLIDGTNDCSRIRLEEFDPDLAEQWSQEGLIQADQAKALGATSEAQSDAATLAAGRFRQACRMPRVLEEALRERFFVDPLPDELDAAAQAVAAEAGRLGQEVKRARQDAELCRLGVPALRAAANLRDRMKGLRHRVCQAILSDGWTSAGSTTPRIDYSEDVRNIEVVIVEEIEGPEQQTRAVLERYGRQEAVLETILSRAVAEARAGIRDLQLLHDRLDRVRSQAEAVRLVQDEAEHLLREAECLGGALDEAVTAMPEQQLAPDDLAIPPILAEQIRKFGTEFARWEGTIADRIPFGDPQGRSKSLVKQGQSLGDPTSGRLPLLDPRTSHSEAPMTPPDTPPTNHVLVIPPSLSVPQSLKPNDSSDHADLDRRVRAKVNELATRVASAWSSLHEKAVSAPARRWRRQAMERIDRLRDSEEEAREDLSEHRTRLQKTLVNADPSAGTSERVLEALKALDAETEPILVSLHAELESGLARLADWCGGDVVANLRLSNTDLVDPTLAIIEATATSAEAIKRALLDAVLEIRAAIDFAAKRTQLPPPRASVMDHGVSEGRDLPDVFGSRIARPSSSASKRSTRTPRSSAGPEAADEIIRSLRRRLDALHFEHVIRPSETAMQATPLLRKLPTPSVADRMKTELVSIQTQASAIEAKNIDEQAALTALQDDMSAARLLLPELDRLAAFSAQIQASDAALSRLLDSLGGHDAKKEDIAERFGDAAVALSIMEETARAIDGDRRVASEVRRVRAAFAELRAMWKDRNGHSVPDSEAGGASDTATVFSPPLPPSPSASSVRRPLPRNGSVASSLSRASTRSISNPTTTAINVGLGAQSYRMPTKASLNRDRDRAVSESPARSRVDGLRNGLPRARHDSLRSNGTPSSLPRQALVAVPDPPHATPRGRKTSHALTRGPDCVKAYVPNERSKLDVAVGKIVNKLKMDVPIVPVGLAQGDEGKDQSGRYWIGAEGRAKLCFCRILRSRTVMVRVGGGWVELSRFLLDHFAEALWETPFVLAQPAEMTDVGGSSTPIAITSASLAEGKGKAARSSSVSHLRHDPPRAFPAAPPLEETSKQQQQQLQQQQVTSSPNPLPSDPTPGRPRTNTRSRIPTLSAVSTPARSIFYNPILPDALAHPTAPPSTPRHTTPTIITSTSMAGTFSPSPGGSGSPLVPLHFIKKASESPPAREREKEMLKAGKRSILGKEASSGE